jgi:hypothetical protein
MSIYMPSEASPGPHDSHCLFQGFLSLMDSRQRKRLLEWSVLSPRAKSRGLAANEADSRFAGRFLDCARNDRVAAPRTILNPLAYDEAAKTIATVEDRVKANLDREPGRVLDVLTINARVYTFQTDRKGLEQFLTRFEREYENTSVSYRIQSIPAGSEYAAT